MCFRFFVSLPANLPPPSFFLLSRLKLICLQNYQFAFVSCTFFLCPLTCICLARSCVCRHTLAACDLSHLVFTRLFFRCVSGRKITPSHISPLSALGRLLLKECLYADSLSLAFALVCLDTRSPSTPYFCAHISFAYIYCLPLSAPFRSLFNLFFSFCHPSQHPSLYAFPYTVMQLVCFQVCERS